MDLPAHVRSWLATGVETPKPGTIQGEVRIIAAPSMALAAAADAARLEGITPVILGDAIEGESRELGIVMAGIAKSVKWHGLPVAAPAVLLSGGETTVSIGKGPAGRGGRNTEFLLGFAVAAAGDPASGPSPATATASMARRMLPERSSPPTRSPAAVGRVGCEASPSDARQLFLFRRIGDLVRTGPTLTNVNDIRAILIA